MLLFICACTCFQKKKKPKQRNITGELLYVEQKREGYSLEHPDLEPEEVEQKLQRKYTKLSEKKVVSYNYIYLMSGLLVVEGDIVLTTLVCCIRVSVCPCLSRFVPAINSTFKHGFQSNLTQLFSLMNRKYLLR